MPYLPLPLRLLEAVDQCPNPRAQMYKAGDHWEGISSTEMLRRIAGIARALAELGVKAGDRVVLFSPNRPEWHHVDFAVLGLGAVSVPIYFNEAPERIVYIVNDAGARVVCAIGPEQVRRLLSIRQRLTGVQHVIVGSAPPDVAESLPRYEALIASAGPAEVAEYRRRAGEVHADALAALIYTSGTTGEPKGVMLTHSNISSNDLDSASEDNDYSAADMGLSFLPLAHVYERMVAYGYIFRGVSVAYVERPEQVQSALLEVRPTIMAAVPRVFEKIYANVMDRGSRLQGWRRRMFDWAMGVARAATPWRAYGRPVSLAVKLQWAIADRVAFPRIRAGLGGRLRGCFSGAAPLSRELLEFFWTVGVKIYQGYGLTETSPVVATNWCCPNKVGTVGRPIRNVQVRIADDGEILVRGPCVMRGYFGKEQETREALSGDGWLRTGDIGHLDADGYLVITDRKKDLLKTAAGKFVAPQPIENRLKTSPFILNVAVLGDRRRFITALIVPNFPVVESEAAAHGLTFSSPAELAAHPWVRERIGQEVSRLTSDMAQYETIKRFALLDHDFTFEGGQLTFTLKLKRRVVEQRYAALIDQLYSEAEEETRRVEECRN